MFVLVTIHVAIQLSFLKGYFEMLVLEQKTQKSYLHEKESRETLYIRLEIALIPNGISLFNGFLFNPI